MAQSVDLYLHVSYDDDFVVDEIWVQPCIAGNGDFPNMHCHHYRCNMGPVFGYPFLVRLLYWHDRLDPGIESDYVHTSLTLVAHIRDNIDKNQLLIHVESMAPMKLLRNDGVAFVTSCKVALFGVTSSMYVLAALLLLVSQKSLYFVFIFEYLPSCDDMPPRGGDEVGKGASLNEYLARLYVNWSSPECSFEVVIVPSVRLLQNILKIYQHRGIGYNKRKLQKGTRKNHKKAKVRTLLCSMEVSGNYERVE